MQLTIDASTLVAESLRDRGRQLIANPILDLYIAVAALGETIHEIDERIVHLERHRHLRPERAVSLRADVRLLWSQELSLNAEEMYAAFVDEAQWRIPRDSDDVPTVALALALDCGIWTADQDFFGCGLPVWTTETLLAYLAHHATVAGR